MWSHPTRGRLLQAVLSDVPSSARPVLHRTVPTRSLSCTPALNSQIGRTPLSLPPEVELNFIPAPPSAGQQRSSRAAPRPKIHVKGPLGELFFEVPAFISIEQNQEARKATVGILDREEKEQREMWGTTRAYIQNHIMGVSEGHTCVLRLVGVGYRATVEKAAVTVSPEFEGQQFVSLKVGYSHPIEIPVPKGVKASTPQPTRILLEGIEKEAVKSLAAKIREWRVPEPYKGKGIFVDNETIKLKAKKIK